MRLTVLPPSIACLLVAGLPVVGLLARPVWATQPVSGIAPNVDAARTGTVLHRVRPRLLSGDRPETPTQWQSLADEGVTLVLSVDGMPSDAVAERVGIARMHVPIGYDGPTGSELARLSAAFDRWQAEGGTLLVHCHHGRHRGPAVAALFARWSGTLSHDDAESVLIRCGTSQRYANLWRLPQRQRPQPSAASVPAESLRRPLGSAMALLDRGVERRDAVLIEKAIEEVERAVPLDRSLSDRWLGDLWQATRSDLRAGRLATQRCTECHDQMDRN